MRRQRTAGIHHTISTKSPTGRRHKPRGHKRAARARDTAIGTGRIKPRGVDGKPTAGRTSAKARILQIHAIGAHARHGPCARGNDAPAAAHGHVACDHAGDRLVRNIGITLCGMEAWGNLTLRGTGTLTATGSQCGIHVSRALVVDGCTVDARADGADIGRMRLRHGVPPGKRQHQVAVGPDGLARVAVKLQVVGIGPRPAGARHARLVVCRVRDDEALRARGIRRPAQQNA